MEDNPFKKSPNRQVGGAQAQALDVNGKEIDISIIIAAYNEQENILLLYRELKGVLEKITNSFEIIFIDDGSKDNTFNILKKLHEEDKRVKVIRFSRNSGQTAAWRAGFKYFNGKIAITMDADLQNDPKDIPLLLNELKKGYDAVSGWRWNRKDKFSKRVYSKIANFLRRILVKEKIHDAGCSLKAYRKEVVKNLDLFGEMHRYITTILLLKGFKIGEVKVNHRKRILGKTKYGSLRLFKGFLDLLYIKFWSSYSTRPLHFFGGLGFIQYFLALFILIEQIIKAIILNIFTVGPLLILVVLLIITGSLSIMFGFISEILTRVYFKTYEEDTLNIKEMLF